MHWNKYSMQWFWNEINLNRSRRITLGLSVLMASCGVDCGAWAVIHQSLKKCLKIFVLKVINILLFWLKAVAERVYKSWVPESQVSYTNIQWLREYLLSALVIDMKRKHLNYLISMQSERKQEDFFKGWPCGNTSIIYKSLFNAHTYSLFDNPTCWINSVRFCTLKLFEKRFVTEGFWGICVKNLSFSH